VPQRVPEAKQEELVENSTLRFGRTSSSSSHVENPERTKIQAALDAATEKSRAALLKGKSAVLSAKERGMQSNLAKTIASKTGRQQQRGGEDEWEISQPEGFRHEKHFDSQNADLDQVQFASQDSFQQAAPTTSFTTDEYYPDEENGDVWLDATSSKRR